MCVDMHSSVPVVLGFVENLVFLHVNIIISSEITLLVLRNLIMLAISMIETGILWSLNTTSFLIIVMCA